jgi:type VI secretion system protein ImpM
VSAGTVKAHSGFYGKLPARGDFLSRGLAQSFIDPLEGWMQLAIAKSRAALGVEWLDRYLTCPIWRYAFSRGVCGDAAYVGIMMSSVDSIGRYFPFTIACPVDDGLAIIEIAQREEDWFARAEDIAVAGLEDDIDLEDFARAVNALSLPDSSGSAITAGYANGTRVNVYSYGEPELAGSAMQRALSAMLGDRHPCFNFWWTTGGAGFSPRLLCASGLPDPVVYLAMLDGAAVVDREASSAAGK